MKKIALVGTALLTTLALSGCGQVMQDLSARDAFDIELNDGRVTQCVQVSSHSGSVAVTCDFDNTGEVTP